MLRPSPTPPAPAVRTSWRARIPWPALRALCSGAALLWILHATPFQSIAATLRDAQPGWLLLGVVFGLLTRLAAAERTLMISRALGLGVSRLQTIETLFISNYYALLSPGPVLSGVVSVYRYRGYGATITGSLSTLLASRAIEAAAFVAVGAACVLGDPHVPLGAVRMPLMLAGAATVLTGGALFAWLLLHRRTRHAPAAPTSPVAAEGLWGKLRAVQHDLLHQGPGFALQAAIPALVQVLLTGAALGFLARALSVDLSWVTAIWMAAAVYAVVLLPISVAGIGVRDLTLIRSLSLLGVGAPPAVALSVLLLADPLLNAVIGGVWQTWATLRYRRDVA